ncbi:alpha/beta-hydrolase [Guyanagaster necrorhizus]|uniref:Alpha/beta-hydrolase n=1 Tax=Guyanagaster necrorhizus TaxID=856835 RepID=A0A9P7W2B4_9AGAR|nr:alpha/beta-hydrolase [Guyanagaster necrorhizus MCA 3950]KAG7451352.1 alpha/beta-hydrolase [Guyanagaster necrorhizus MCA 3950]
MTEALEKYLTLSDGRRLAYADNGDPASSLVIVFYHGVFGVGRAPRMSPALRELGVHFVAPTLPGWGKSDPRPKDLSYPASLTSDFTTLINHLHPNDDNLRIYISGGSFGTVPAQILYGASFDAFPLGRKIVGCLLLAPFSPFKWDKGYTKGMTWQNYISVGPPSQLFPFRAIPRMLVAAISAQMGTVERAEVLIRKILFDKTDERERKAFAKWREQNGIAEGQLEREFAENAKCSIAMWREGFLETSDDLHCDWGFCPNQLDEEHSKRPLLVVASTSDELGPDMAKWLVGNYANAKLEWVQGGHIAALYELDGIWKRFIEEAEGTIIVHSDQQ